MKMTNARLDGLRFMLLGSLTFILLSVALEYGSPVAMVDFRTAYYCARCLVQHCDPYKESEVLRIAEAEGGNRPWDTERPRYVMRYIYPPTVFSFTVPFAMLPYGPSHILWGRSSSGAFSSPPF